MTFFSKISKITGYLACVFTNKCPKCRKGRLFVSKNPYNLKKTLAMHEKCSVCGQKTELETGFYYGTGYVSYALAVAFSVTTVVIWATFFRFSFFDDTVLYWLACNTALLIVLQPPLMRLARSLWISWFVPYKGDGKNKL